MLISSKKSERNGGRWTAWTPKIEQHRQKKKQNSTQGGWGEWEMKTSAIVYWEERGVSSSSKLIYHKIWGDHCVYLKQKKRTGRRKAGKSKQAKEEGRKVDITDSCARLRWFHKKMKEEELLKHRGRQACYVGDWKKKMTGRKTEPGVIRIQAGSWWTAECQVGGLFCKQQHCMFSSYHTATARETKQTSNGEGDERGV